MIEENTLKMIDDETLKKHIIHEWFIRTSELLKELANELGNKYQCEVFYYSHDGLYRITRNIPYYKGDN